MKVVLARIYSATDHILPSLGLGYLATSLRKKRHEALIIDGMRFKYDIPTLVNNILRQGPKMVGFQCLTLELEGVKNALAGIKEKKPEIICVAGGPHPSALPEQTMEYLGKNVDFVFQGEAEESLPMLAALLEAGTLTGADLETVPGLVWRNRDSIAINPKKRVDDLDGLGIPAWDLQAPALYPPEVCHGAVFRKSPIAPLMITRGCPFNCEFCAGHLITGREIRARSIDSIEQELDLLSGQFGVREIHVVDDNFTMRRDRIVEFCELLLRRRWGFAWAVPNGVRLDFLDPELIALMKRSGLYCISAGIESGSDRILGRIGKKITTGIIRERMQWIKDAGLESAGFFILGFPTETPEEMESTIRFARELPLTRANFFIYMPLPGTKSFQELLDRGAIRLDNIDWSQYSFATAPIVALGQDRTRLRRIQRKAFFSFYFRPKIVLSNLKRIRSVKHLKALVLRFFHWLR